MADYISKYETGAAVDAALDLAMSALQPESGKGLSTNDFTNEYKDKVDSNDAEISSARGSYATVNERLSGIESEQESQGTALDEDRAALVEIVDNGAKNRLNYNIATFGDKSKVTINQDGSITGSITSDTRQYTWSNREFEFTLQAGDYVFCIKRLSGSNVHTSARLMTAENNNICTVATNPNIAPSTKSFTLDTDTTIGFIGKVFTDTIQLMLCTAEDYAISSEFVPYAMSNRELTEEVETNKNNISLLTAELHALLPNITASTTIQDYVNSLSKGVYTAFIANVSNPPDSPINANCFVNIYVYSAASAAVELIPLSAAETPRTYTMRKVSGTWRGWYVVEGTPVASSTQSTAALMSAKSTIEALEAGT